MSEDHFSIVNERSYTEDELNASHYTRYILLTHHSHASPILPLNKQQVETCRLISNKGVFANKIISLTSTKESSRFLLAHPPCHCTAANVSTSAVYSGGDSIMIRKKSAPDAPSLLRNRHS
jgi:hypothetical protein